MQVFSSAFLPGTSKQAQLAIWSLGHQPDDPAVLHCNGGSGWQKLLSVRPFSCCIGW